MLWQRKEVDTGMSRREDYESRTEALLQPIAAGQGVEIYDVEYVKEGKDYYLRFLLFSLFAILTRSDSLYINPDSPVNLCRAINPDSPVNLCRCHQPTASAIIAS